MREKLRTSLGASRGTLLALASFCLAAALLAPTVLAAPSWLAPANLSLGGQDAEKPQVAIDRAGNAVAVWTRSDGSDYIVQAATKPAGGTWGAAVDLSVPGENAFDPQVAVNPVGDAVAVWARSNGTDFIIQAASRPAGGAWGPPVDLSATGGEAEEPDVALDQAGNAVAVWPRAGANIIVEAASKPAGGSWGSAVPLSTPGQDAFGAIVASNASGDAVAAWQRSNGSDFIAQAATKPAGGEWEGSKTLSGFGQDAYVSGVAIDQAGNAVATWWRSNGTHQVAQAATKPAGAAWQSPDDLSDPGETAFGGDVVIDPAGNAVASWQQDNGSNGTAQAATKPVGGTWGAPADLSAPGQDASGPQLAVNQAGTVVATWQGSNGTNVVAESATKQPGAAWSAATDLSAGGGDAYSPTAALDPAGNAVAVWELSAGVTSVIQTAGYDATAPELRALSIPASGPAGKRLPFSVSPFDAWSALAAVDWRFGDRRTASGALARHAYRKPGSYLVTVTGSDLAANATGATGRIAIWQVKGAGVAGVERGKARLRLRCRGPVRCRSVAKLSLRVRGTSGKGRAKPLQIGKARFKIAARKSKTIAFELRPRGLAALLAAGAAGLKVRLTGTGVKARAVVLDPS